MEMVEKGKTETIGSRGPRKGISDEGKFHKRIMEQEKCASCQVYDFKVFNGLVPFSTNSKAQMAINDTFRVKKQIYSFGKNYNR